MPGSPGSATALWHNRPCTIKLPCIDPLKLMKVVDFLVRRYTTMTTDINFVSEDDHNYSDYMGSLSYYNSSDHIDYPHGNNSNKYYPNEHDECSHNNYYHGMDYNNSECINYNGIEQVQEVYQVCLPLILLGGTVGNALSFAVMVRKEMRKFSSSLYLALLAVSDTIYIWTYGLWYLVTSISGHNISIYTDCKLDYFLQNFSYHYSAWLLVSVTIERFICIYFPFKARLVCSLKNTKIVCAVLAVLLVGVNFPQFLARHGENGCGPYANWNYFIYNVCPLMNMLIYSFLPSLVMAITNGLIVYKMKKSAGDQGQVQNTAMTKHSQKITIMLLTVSTVFICFTLPAEVYTIYVERTDYNIYYNDIWFALVNLLKILNHSINFCLYILTATKFQNELKNMMCTQWRVAPEEQVSGDVSLY